jgi:hypothetical protein
VIASSSAARRVPSSGVRRDRAALGAGVVVLGLVACCSGLAWQRGSPLVPRNGGIATGRTAGLFLLLLALAFLAYVIGLALVRRGRAGLPLVLALAGAIQLAPLAAPLLLSTDAWTYWDYGRTAAIHGANPYRVPPAAFPGDPALEHMGAAWRAKTTVYGPAFTLASEPVALAAGDSASAAAWTFKVLAALGILAATALAAQLARRRAALAAALVGWNPVLAIHLAGGGHNDAWIGALVLAALALAAGRRPYGAGVVWALAVAIKWVPLVFLALAGLATKRERRRPLTLGLASGAAVIVGLATWRYGWHWLDAFVPLADNARLETSYALPHRLRGAGLPRGVALGLAVAILTVGLLWLAWSASRGRVRLALASCLVLLTTPYLAVWYLGWVVPLAAADEDDRLARVLAVGLSAYLLPQTIPH